MTKSMFSKGVSFCFVFIFILSGCGWDLCGGNGECCCDPDNSCDNGLTCTYFGGDTVPFACSYRCTPTCEWYCFDRECGPNPGCEGSCGLCSSGEICELGKCRPELCKTTMVGSIAIPGDAVAVQVSGHYAYVAAMEGGFFIVDVSNPSSPHLVGSHEPSEEKFLDVFVSGNHAFLINRHNRYGYQLQIFNVINPSSPNLIGAFSADDPQAVFVAGDYAYLADGYAGLKIIDVSHQASPSLSSSFDVPNGIEARAIFVAGNYAYLVDDGGLSIIDISNPYSPSLVGTASLDYYVGGPIHVHVKDKIAYFLSPTFWSDNQLEIYDVSKPSAPKKLSDYEIQGYANDLFVAGKHVFIANDLDELSGLQVVDVTNPSSPHLVGSLALPGGAMSVFVSGEFVFIGEDDTGLSIVDSPDCH